MDLYQAERLADELAERKLHASVTTRADLWDVDTPLQTLLYPVSARGERILKYGQTIGFARLDIAPGEHVHTHNVELGTLGLDYAFCQDFRPVDFFQLDAGEAAAVRQAPQVKF